MLRKLLGLDRRSTTVSGLSARDPDAYETLFGESLTTTAGERMSHRRALTYAPVWQAVSMISGDVAKLPLEVKRFEYLDDERVRQTVARGHRWYRPMAWQANAEQSAFRFWRRVLVHLLLWNRAYVLIGGTRRRPALLPLLPDRTYCEFLDSGRMVTEGMRPQLAEQLHGEKIYCTEVDGRLYWYWPHEVLEFTGLALDDTEVPDLLHYARESWALGLAQQKFASRFFRAGGRIGGILEVPPARSSGNKKGVDKLEESFKARYASPEAAFQTIVLRDGAKFHEAQRSFAETQLVEATEQQARQVARWFNLAPSRLGLSDSVSYNSKAEDNQAYLDSTLSHWLREIAGECDLKLLSDSERAPDQDYHRCQYATAAILALDPLKRAQVHAIYIRNGILDQDEVRQIEGYNPRDEIEAPPAAGPTVAEPAEQDSDGGEAEQNGDEGRGLPLVATRVLFDATRRARQKARSTGAFCEFIDGGLREFRQALRDAGQGEHEDRVIGELVEQLRHLAETRTKEALPAAVDQVAADHEARFLQ